MTRRYEVVITDRALAEVDAIGSYIAADHPLNAVRFVDRLLRAVKTLGVMPLRCPLAPEGIVRDLVTRNLVVGAYRIVFTVESTTVTVHGVRHAARRPAEL